MVVIAVQPQQGEGAFLESMTLQSQMFGNLVVGEVGNATPLQSPVVQETKCCQGGFKEHHQLQTGGHGRPGVSW
jgi:hypothetical protein